MKTEQSTLNYVISIYKWLKFSGATVTAQVNPLHWRLLPWAKEELNREWPTPNERTWAMGWLFLIVRVWIDNGDW